MGFAGIVPYALTAPPRFRTRLRERAVFQQVQREDTPLTQGAPIMQTLLELFGRMEAFGGREAVRHWDGYRLRKWSYKQLVDATHAAAARLDEAGVGPGERVLLWAENSPEWIAWFWACVLRGVAVVPVDFRSSAELANRILADVGARVALCGADVDRAAIVGAPVWRLDEALEAGSRVDPVEAEEDDIVEIVYTSGSTGEPKGIAHRHRNICANLTGIDREITRFRALARPFQPIRTLDLLPLSHLFGQSMGIYIPVLLGGAVVFSSKLGASSVLDVIRRNRVSVLAAVPQMLANLRQEVERSLPAPPGPPRFKGLWAVPETWWRYRGIHRRTGWKFWAAVVGGALLDEDLERFWKRTGFGVVQGYGLTEASPVVALNHPFSSTSGSLGKPLPGQEVKIADDGEILVRGPSVAQYYGDQPESSSTRFRDGWLHTGDLGEFDSKGRLLYRGRKGDLIVRADGMNVHPQDIEAVLRRTSGVRDCAVVGVRREGGERVHAAVVLEGAADLAQVVEQANATLESHQRIQESSAWEEEDLPRTASTMKIRRGELARLIVEGDSGAPKTPASEGGDLGLSSLERVELLSQLEERLGTEIDEARFSAVSTQADLDRLIDETRSGTAPGPTRRRTFPRWALEPRWTVSAPVRWARRALTTLVFMPLARRYLKFTISGSERLAQLDSPVVFAANHSSHLDTIAVYAALPAELRRRVAPAMSQDFFRALFGLRDAALPVRAWEGFQFLLACGLFNAYPLPQKLAGARRALRYTAELVDSGYSPLIYPEGTRSTDGSVLRFKPGVALIARKLGVRVVPVRIDGLFELFPAESSWPKAGPISVAFGAPIEVGDGESLEAAAARIREALLRLPSLTG